MVVYNYKVRDWEDAGNYQPIDRLTYTINCEVMELLIWGQF